MLNYSFKVLAEVLVAKKFENESIRTLGSGVKSLPFASRSWQLFFRSLFGQVRFLARGSVTVNIRNRQQ